MSIEKIINEMESFYRDYGKDKDLEYAYGFFDAVGILKNLRNIHMETLQK